MSSPEALEPSGSSSGPAPSLLQRAVLVFTRPAQAWNGLEARVQWWFPLLIVLIVTVASAALLHQRALLPMITEQWDQAVQEGQMPAAQAERMETFFAGPAGLAIMAGQQVIVTVLITLLVGLMIWVGCGFVLGTRLRYRLALEVAAWSSLISIPSLALTTVIAWTRETMRGVHVGFGALLPEPETPNRLLTGLGVFLDAIGPLGIWYLVVAILGAAALSGAKRSSVAWVLGGLYLAMVIFFSLLAGMFVRGA